MAVCEPVRVVRDTWLIPRLAAAAPLGQMFINSAVITAAEPVVVDTGAPDHAAWLEQLGSIVDLRDVRWIFISHDDIDHVGNLRTLLELCPAAVVLTTWFAAGRLAADQGLVLPRGRVRFVNDGDTIDVGDRVLRAVLPPVYDKATTRGLFDPTTGFYWAADCFCASVPGFVPEAADIPAAQWREDFLRMHQMISPWHALLDHRRYAAVVDRLQSLPLTAACGAHGPIVRDTRLPDAVRMLRELPHLSALTPFGQGDLEVWPATATTGHGSTPELRDRVPSYPRRSQ